MDNKENEQYKRKIGEEQGRNEVGARDSHGKAVGGVIAFLKRWKWLVAVCAAAVCLAIVIPLLTQPKPLPPSPIAEGTSTPTPVVSASPSPSPSPSEKQMLPDMANGRIVVVARKAKTDTTGADGGF